jgi:hypothetical protein
VTDERPFEDVQETAEGFSIPELKWRELLFVGALRREGEAFMRDPSRPMQPFRKGDLFPEGVRFMAIPDGARVRIRRVG